MKLKETITDEMWDDAISHDIPLGLFKELSVDFDSITASITFYSLYGEREIAPSYRTLIEKAGIEIANIYVQHQLINNYGTKWEELYGEINEVFSNAQEIREEYEERGTDRTEYTYDTQTTNNTKNASKITRSFTNDETESIVPFNTPEYVGVNNTETTNSETEEGKDTDNYTNGTGTKTGTDVHTRTPNLTRINSGHRTPLATLFGEQIDYRNKYRIMDIIFNDIAREILLQIYI